ncbi:reductase [Nocardioides psychrotolerans]|uniref:Nucleoside-diphosphate-sugar epimerase n=1 Tax=Nocardioides psychrotolerans TaxID=1005945 RepID=A0A1I3E9X4_9ACTN|nr:NAD-dependent epimerase/dehydratase family protein [Nocardioides psychrotolerans]GEP37458.1 reductase [Nocardioides psychrotolerans]SFH95653.1 Nucleoside-diphosphate-sugar epimerase [Nocardioides psychrotolerans]
MRILVLGGTVFLSRATAAVAVRRGHDVVCAARGSSGSVPDGARLVVWDRDQPAPASLLDESFDAVVDVARHPSRVLSAVATFPSAHWLFVSTVNVYPDDATPGLTPTTGAVHEPLHDDDDLAVDPEAYGPMKVACEEIVRDGTDGAMVVRPGLIVGPGDPTGRFTYWPARLAEVGPGDPVLAPGAPSDTVQVIDVRDLATWFVASLEGRLGGDFDGTGPVTPIADLLAATAAGVGAEPGWTWVDQDFLTAQEVAPWSGPGSLPLWLPRPSYDGMLAHDPTPSLDAGLVTRAIEETARDTLAWLRATPDAVVSGMTRERETDLLDRWVSRRGHSP